MLKEWIERDMGNEGYEEMWRKLLLATTHHLLSTNHLHDERWNPI